MSNPINGFIYVCIIEDDARTFTAKLEGNIFEIRFGRSLHDLSSYKGRASKGDLWSDISWVRTAEVEQTFSIAICSVIAAPTVGPYPVTTLIEPSGKPTSLMRLHTLSAVKGVNSEGLSTMALPVASAGPTFQVNIRTRKKDEN